MLLPFLFSLSLFVVVVVVLVIVQAAPLFCFVLFLICLLFAVAFVSYVFACSERLVIPCITVALCH